MAGLNVDITADTRQFQAEVENVPQTLQKISDELQDVTAAGDRTGSSLESSMRQAQQESAQTESAFRDLATSAEQSGQRQSEAFELSNREVNKIQKESLTTTASSLSQIVQQGASAMDGTVKGALDAIGNISTGIAVFGGPEVAAAAGGIALATSVISALFEKAQADAKASEADVAALTKALEDLGANGPGSVASVNDNLKQFSQTTDGSEKDLEALKSTADQAGVSWVQYARAVAGSTDDQEELFKQVQKMIGELDTQAKAWDGSSDTIGTNYGKLEKQLAGLQSVSDELVKQNSTLALSKDRVNDLSAAQQEAAQVAAAESQAQKDYTANTLAAFDGIGSSLASAQQTIDSNIAQAQKSLDTAIADSAGKRTKAVIDAERNLADAQSKQNQNTAQAFLDQQNQDIADIEAAGKAKVQIYEKFGDEAVQVIKAAGSNTSLLESLAGASPDQVQAIISNYQKLGQDAGTNFQQTAQQELDNNPLLVKAAVEADYSAFVNRIQGALDRHTFQISANVTGVHLQGGTAIL